MKSRFTTIDIRAAISELRGRLAGMRVVNVYDIDNKTYLIKFAKPDMKAMLLMESGIRIHSTEFDWPKNMVPSGFSMKMRKHLRGRRLEKIELVGIDRIVDLQFGSDEAAYHVILELYDRGNIILTDFEYVILNILRPRANESEDVRFAVRERYPLETARQHEGLISQEQLTSILLAAKEGDNLKKTLNPHLVYGPAVIQHSLLVAGLPENARIGKDFHIEQDMPQLIVAMQEAERLLELSNSGSCKGFVIQKSEKKAVLKEDGEPQELLTYAEFHPFLYRQNESATFLELEHFDKAVDEFYSNIGTQKLDMKALQQEKSALKKLDNVKRDHEKRVEALRLEQGSDALKAKLIEMNDQLVDQAIKVVQSALANQIDWTEIGNIVKEAQARDDPVASAIKGLKLETNHITMLLKDPFGDSEDEEDGGATLRPMKIDIDLGMTTYANARRYFDMKRYAAKKEQKTLESSGKALKSAEKKTKQTLKDVQTSISIQKARKTYWFEKFLWFISSENFVVIGGRDQQQNEIIVKKYLRPGDMYVHADLHGASSVIIKNPAGGTIPPKTLNEAGTMAICNSAAWDAKVVTSAWWVRHDQVSKTAPTGEYLGTGSFMIRGKKNFLPPSYLIYGFGFLFKLEDASVPRHKGERRVRTLDDDGAEPTPDPAPDSGDDVSIENDSSSDNDGEKESVDEKQLSMITEDDGVAQVIDDDDGIETKQCLMSEENVCSQDGKNKAVDDIKSRTAKLNLDGGDVKSEANVMSETLSTAAKSDVRIADDIVFPDTSIELHHVKGNKFKLQRSVGRHTSTGSHGSEGDDEDLFFLGDDQPVKLGEKVSSSGRISAKQRREMKKRAKLAAQDSEPATEKDEQPEMKESEVVETEETIQGLRSAKEEEEAEDEPEPEVKNAQQHQQQQQAPPVKRGQKAKQKKIKEKYKHQDEEERRLKMEILASAGAPKEVAGKKKKGKKSQKQDVVKPADKQQETTGKQGEAVKQPPVRKHGPLTIEDITTKPLTTDKTAGDGDSTQKSCKTEVGEPMEDKEEDDNVPAVEEDANILDTLTGLPVAEDELLFCIPVSAPYSILINYKYKVKLTPGGTKRGKAAKTALHMFSCDRSASLREKDIFRSLKDIDMSRNIPGKVKVSAPNLHKKKH